MPPDSLFRVQPRRSSDIDTTIRYTARDFFHDIENRTSTFLGEAVINYKNMSLKAGKITLDWDARLMTAEPLPDTVWVADPETDSSQVIQSTGQPVLVEGGTPYTGDKMVYNYKTKKALVVRGRTEFEDGFYRGRQIKKVTDNSFNVSHSSFTTCDLDSNPHFHFEARRLKIITNDKIIAKPVIMFIGHVPVAALPFVVFPHKTGRQSGLIIPRYGESQREGRYLRGLGYYWAPNDYFDANAMVDYFEKSGWLFRGGANYKVRYLMEGRISGSLTRKSFSEEYQERRWDLRVSHSQEIDPTSRLAVSGSFASDKNFYRNLSSSLTSRLRRELRSNATYSKSWPKQKLSLSVNLSQVHDLEDDVKSQTLPQVSFRKGTTQIFKPETPKRRGRRRRPQPKWYHSLYFSTNSTLLNSSREFLSRTSQDTVKEIDRTRTLKHNINLSLNSPKKYFGWLALNQSLNLGEDWFDKTQSYELDAETSQIESREVKGFAARHTFSYNATANTKLYGLFTPDLLDIQAIRHVVTPSITFRYQPDFSDPAWGYYTEVVDASGETVKKDRFGGTPGSGSQVISFSVRNLFQMKRGTGEQERKIDLFNVDFSSGYNFKVDTYRLSDLSSSWRANPARNFSLSARTSHSFYDWDRESGARIHQYLFDHRGWLKGKFIRLTSLQLSFSLRLQGKGSTGSRGGGRERDGFSDGSEYRALEEDMNVLEEDLSRDRDPFEPDRAFRSLSIPWRMNVRFNFALDKRRNPNQPQKKYYLDVSGAEINLTKNWRIGYSAHYDLESKSISHHRLTFYRDLHCWEANVDWVPSGINKRVFFRINVKAPSLQDIKLEKGGGVSPGVLGGYY